MADQIKVFRKNFVSKSQNLREKTRKNTSGKCFSLRLQKAKDILNMKTEPSESFTTGGVVSLLTSVAPESDEPWAKNQISLVFISIICQRKKCSFPKHSGWHRLSIGFTLETTLTHKKQKEHRVEN